MHDPASERASDLRSRVATRLRPMCAEWPPDLFERVVDNVVRITLKHDAGERRAKNRYDPTATEHLIADMRQLADRSSDTRERLD